MVDDPGEFETELLMYCQNEQYIQDKLGAGAQPIKI